MITEETRAALAMFAAGLTKPSEIRDEIDRLMVDADLDRVMVVYATLRSAIACALVDGGDHTDLMNLLKHGQKLCRKPFPAMADRMFDLTGVVMEAMKNNQIGDSSVSDDTIRLLSMLAVNDGTTLVEIAQASGAESRDVARRIRAAIQLGLAETHYSDGRTTVRTTANGRALAES